MLLVSKLVDDTGIKPVRASVFVIGFHRTRELLVSVGQPSLFQSSPEIGGAVGGRTRFQTLFNAGIHLHQDG
jgi:hypothetical protein